MPPASQVRGGARHARGAGRSLAAAATAGAGRRRHRCGVRGPHREREGRTAAAVVKLLYGLHGGRREEQAARGEKEAGTQTSSAHRSPRAEDSTSPYSAHPPCRREEATPPSPRLVLSAFLPRFLLRESSTLHGVGAVASAKPRSAAPSTNASACPCGLTQVVMSG